MAEGAYKLFILRNTSHNDICHCKNSAAIKSVCACHSIYSERQNVDVPAGGHTGGRSHKISPPFLCGACLVFFR